MIVKGFIAALAFTLAGFHGCSKSPPPVAAARPAPSAAPSKIKDLGVLQLTNHWETCVPFGPGRDCRIIPKLLDRHNVQLTLTLESKNSNGTISGLSVVQMTGDAQKQFEISIGDTDFTFIPQIADAQ